MPYLSIETNKKVDAGIQFTKAATTFIAELLEKPEKYVMISLKEQQEMRFAGSTDYTAFVHLKSIGFKKEPEYYIPHLFDFVTQELNINKERIYVELTDLERNKFAWNGKSFNKM